MTSTDAIVYGASAIGSAGVVWWLARRGLLPPGLDRLGGGAGRRGSPIGRDVSGVPAAIWLLGMAAVFLGMSLGASLAAALGPAVTGAEGGIRHQAIASACFFGAGALAAAVMLYLIQPRTTAATGAALPGRGLWGDLWRGAACLSLVAPVYVAVNGASQWVSEHVFHTPTPAVAHSALEIFVRDPWSAWALAFAAVAVVLTPIAEESLYRLFLQSFLLRVFGMVGSKGGEGSGGAPARAHVWAAVFATSAIFAALHALPAGRDRAGPVPWVAVPGLFVLALGLGLGYERTRRLGVPIVMHGLFNLANLVLAGMGTA